MGFPSVVLDGSISRIADVYAWRQSDKVIRGLLYLTLTSAFPNRTSSNHPNKIFPKTGFLFLLPQIADTMVTASLVPTILSILKKSYLEYRTWQVTSEASTPSSRKGNERNSEKNWG